MDLPSALKAAQVTAESRSALLPTDRSAILDELLEFHSEREPLRAPSAPFAGVEATTAKTGSLGEHLTHTTSVRLLLTSTSKTKRLESTFQPLTVPSDVPKSTSFCLLGSHSRHKTLHAVRIVTFLLLGVASSALQTLTVPLEDEEAMESPSGE